MKQLHLSKSRKSDEVPEAPIEWQKCMLLNQQSQQVEPSNLGVGVVVCVVTGFRVKFQCQYGAGIPSKGSESSSE
jgi:hypothetical protein